MAKLPWSERVNAISINPDMATRDDIAKMAAEIQGHKADINRCIDGCDALLLWAKGDAEKDLKAIKETLQRILEEGSCNWDQGDEHGYDPTDTWETDCGNYYTIFEGTPDGNNMKFCCFCGKPLIEKPFVPEQEDE